ncbi:unnamed protein product [Somion occarium]|uniref:F-box domain-containing protein n=1 Tax=Somion occarium TaxID=3059160 RepID=A0ABP1CNU9_9APHY
MKFTDLPSDVVDRILISISDFQTLSASLRTSKRDIYDIFQARPKSIVQIIAYNITGPTLAQALRVASMQRLPEFLFTSSQDIHNRVADEAHAIEKLLTRDNIEALIQNANVVSKLEDVFSQRYKDRKSAKSTLSCAESERFHRATYRIWFLILLQERVPAHEARDEILKVAEDLNHAELLEMDRVRVFFQELYSWSHVAEFEQLSTLRFDARPDQVLQAFEEFNTLPFEEYRQDDAPAHINDALNDVWCKRHRCLVVKGIQLWGASNWDLLRGYISNEIFILFPGYLRNSLVEIQPFKERIRERDDDLEPTLSFSRLLEELFDVDAEADEDWDKTQWYCIDCLRTFLKHRLWRLLLQWKLQEPNYQPKRDCWYGYDCRTQTHRLMHAQRLNHLCVPTRGDPAPFDND